MAITIDARVKQKTGVASDFAGYTLLEGEIALVRTSATGPVYNFKVGPGNFDDLPWSLNFTGVPTAVSPGFSFPSGQAGLYVPEENGTYNGVSVSLSDGVNYLVWDGSSLTKVVFPVDLSGYAKKQDVSPLVWGVADNNNNVAMFLDGNLEFHAKIAENSWPPPRIPTMLSEQMDFGVTDTHGNIIFGIMKNGSVYPPQPGVPPAPTPAPTPVTDTRAEDITQPSNIVKDGIWNQWIEPVSVEDTDGNVWTGSVSMFGGIYITKMSPNGQTIRKKIGVIRSSEYQTDDHNAPAILLDERPGADYPIMIFQCDHNTTPMRMWRFGTMDITEWDVDSWTDVMSGNLAYCQPHRYGDEIFVFARVPGLPRPWRILYSSDNGDTWTGRNIFSSPATWLYMLTKKKDNDNGLNMGCVGHPINSSEQSVFFLELDFVTGEVRSPGNGVVIEDIRAAIEDTEFDPIDPFDVGMTVYQAQGTESCRMWDVSRGDDTVSVVFSVFPSLSTTMQNFRESVYKAVTFDTSTGTVSRETDMGGCGMPMENPKGSNFYVAGACMLDGDNALLCVWKNQSMIDGGNDTVQDYGRSWLYHYNLNTDVKTEIIQSDLKVMRPIATTGSNYIALSEASKFVTYDDFKSNVLIISKTDLNL